MYEMGNFVLTLLVGAGGMPGYQGPPSLTMAPTYHASMTACVEAGRRAQRDLSSQRVGVRFTCSYRGDQYTSRNPFGDW